MAELSLSGTSTEGPSAVQDEDGDFEPTADMLVHDFDDEQTLEEEEMLQGETNFSAEIDDLTREGEMPIHELLKMYGYGGEDSAGDDEGTEEQDIPENDQKSPAQRKAKSNKEGGESCDQEEDVHSSSDESSHCKRTLGTAQLICPEQCSYFDGNDGDESEDEDYIPSEEWKKDVKVGPMFQAETPEGLCKYEDNEKAYENDDQLLWNPELIPENEVVEYLAEASKRTGEETGVEAVPERPLIKDNEQALYELVKCNFDKEEALSKLKFNVKPVKEDLSFWTKEDQDFEQGDEASANDYSGEVKQFKLWRRKPSLYSGVLDFTKQLSSETASVVVSQRDMGPATSSSTTNDDADSQSTDQPLACDHSCTNGSKHSLYFNRADQQPKWRGDEDSSESPMKWAKMDCLIGPSF